MKKTYRRALLFGAVLIFIAITPVIVLYAIGYRGGLTSADPLPVGVLLVESEPTRAAVYINDSYSGRTPHSIPNLSAGQYMIRVAKDGYQPWQKQLSIEPGRATEIRDIRLFPSDVKPAIIIRGAAAFSLSPNRRLLAVRHANNSLAVYSPTGDEVMAPQAFRFAIKSIIWSPNSDAVLLQTGGARPYWYLAVSPRAVPLAVPALNKAMSVVWDPRVPARLLWLDKTANLRAYHIHNASQATLLNKTSHFAPSASSIFAIRGGQEVTEYSLQGEPTGQSYALPAGEVQELLVTPQKNVALLLKNQEAWVLNNDGQFILVGAGLQSIAWSPTGELLLAAAQDSSLYVYNVSDKRTAIPLQELRLVQRLSRPISDPQWFAGSRHLIYQVDDAIWITETDTRDHPVSFKVDTTNTGAASATVGEAGEVLFYLKKDGLAASLAAASLLVE